MATKAQIDKAKQTLLLEDYQIMKPNELKCICCGKTRSVWESSNWIMSNSPLHKGNEALYKWKPKDKDPETRMQSFAPTCRRCIEGIYLKDADLPDLIESLRILDKPYKKDIWDKIVSEKGHRMKPISMLGEYNSNLMMNHRDETFKDSDDYSDENSKVESFDTDGTFLKKREKKEAVMRWGVNWTEFELMKLEEFYHNMKRANKIETPQDEDYLKKLARLSVKIDNALDGGDGNPKQLGDLYSKFVTDSKFRAMDMTDADKQGGIRTFSQIYAEVESPDFIPPWEKYAKFLNVGQDLIDKTIMHIENFTLRFNNAERMAMPPDNTPKNGDDLDE